MTAESVSMKMETEKLREEVKEETRKKQVAESSYKMLCEEKGKNCSAVAYKISVAKTLKL